MTLAKLSPVALAVLLLAGCSASTKPPRPTVNVTLAATYSATLDAAQGAYTRLAVENRSERNAGSLTAEQYQSVKGSLRRLAAALNTAADELNIYLYSGVETEQLRAAFAKLEAARRDTDLLWEAVHGSE